MEMEKELKILESLASSLKKTKDLGEKQELLIAHPRVAGHLQGGQLDTLLPHAADLSAKIALFSVFAIEQHEVLFSFPSALRGDFKTPVPRKIDDFGDNFQSQLAGTCRKGENIPERVGEEGRRKLPQKARFYEGEEFCNRLLAKEKVRALLMQLTAVDRFYDSIGGIVGYQAQVLQQLLAKNEKSAPAASVMFSRAGGIDLSTPSKEVNQAIWSGLRALGEIGEIYPIGGLGSRLNLVNKKTETLPVACLPFCGRTLLEGLVRDVQAREFLYYRLFNHQVTIPIAMMTSNGRHNIVRIRAICEKMKWFGRPHESFKLFSQISVPVVSQEGMWSMKAPFEMNLQPGGHGALWKAAEEAGVFFWLQSQEKNRLLIRQINNPIAGLDFSLLALLGIGKKEKKAFGFASCERLPHAAEGILVHVKEGSEQRLSNIEYTDFKRYGIEDKEVDGGYSLYPANTNILYADLNHILPVIKKNPLPGLVLNMKNKELFHSPSGSVREMYGGRLESMMQNISDALVTSSNEPLPTFLTYNARRRTISAAKRSFEPGKSLLETPEGAFYDLLYNAHELLSHTCGVTTTPFSTQEEYLLHGPSLLFLYHPALGPLYSLIAEKIKGGNFAHLSEMQLEIADLFMENLSLDGSLFISAQNVLGHDSQGIIRYSQRTGKCFLKNVQIVNQGINRTAAANIYWKNQIKRHQSLRIVLQGHSEFHAEGIAFNGAQTIVVPDGERWIAYEASNGRVAFHVEKAGWKWEYQENDGHINYQHPV